MKCAWNVWIPHSVLYAIMHVIFFIYNIDIDLYKFFIIYIIKSFYINLCEFFKLYLKAKVDNATTDAS